MASNKIRLTTQTQEALPVANGGTGQTSYTDGQLLIGNTATGGLNKSTLSAGTGITITNGNGTIEIAASSGGKVFNSLMGGRISLTTSSVMDNNVQGASASTLYYIPHTGDTVSLYYNNAWDLYNIPTGTPLSLSLSGYAADTNFDIFLTPTSTTACILESIAWSTDTTRSQAISFFDGVLTLTSDRTKRYVGTIRTSSTIGRSDWTVFGNGTESCKLYVYNYYNQVPVTANCPITTGSWSYTTAAWRAVNNTTNSSIFYVNGYYINGVFVEGSYRYTTTNAKAYLSISTQASQAYTLDDVGFDASASGVSGMSGQQQILKAQSTFSYGHVSLGLRGYTLYEYGGTGVTAFGGAIVSGGGSTTGLIGTFYM